MKKVRTIDYLFSILMLFSAVLMFACNTESVNPYTSNNAPIIENITLIPNDSLEIGQVLQVSVVARDVEGDSLTFNWLMSGGNALDSADLRKTRLRWLCNDIGRWTLTVQVSDSWHTTSRSLTVWTLPPEAVNHPPAIISLTLTPNEAYPGDTILAVCQASDLETPTEELIVLWSSQLGSWLEPRNFTAQWIAPLSPGRTFLTVNVSDGRLTTSDSLQITVSLRPEILYQTDFSTDEVSNRWSYAGLLAGLGQQNGPHTISWDSTAKALRVEGRSNYGTFAFQMNNGRFGDATFKVKMRSTDLQFSHAGFIPKFVDVNHYLLIAINYYQQSYKVLARQNDTLRYLAEGWKAFAANRDYLMTYDCRDGEGVVKLDDYELWRGAAPDFGGNATIGVAVYGLFDSGALLFDDLSVIR